MWLRFPHFPERDPATGLWCDPAYPDKRFLFYDRINRVWRYPDDPGPGAKRYGWLRLAYAVAWYLAYCGANYLARHH